MRDSGYGARGENLRVREFTANGEVAEAKEGDVRVFGGVALFGLRED